MSVDRLERVLWRLRKLRPASDAFTNPELARAIMFECGTDPATISKNRCALKRLGWIKTKGSRWVLLTNNDLTGDD